MSLKMRTISAIENLLGPIFRTALKMGLLAYACANVLSFSIATSEL